MPAAPSHALLALNALIDELGTLRAHQAWEEALDGLGDSPAILRGEEVLLHIEWPASHRSMSTPFPH